MTAHLTDGSGLRTVGAMQRRTEHLSDGTAVSGRWISTRTAEGVEVHARMARRDGRIVVSGLLIECDEVTTDVLRQVQPARILARLMADDIVLAEADELLVHVPGRQTAILQSVGPGDDSLTLGELRANAPLKIKGRKRRLLGRPDGKEPELFYRKVAIAYRSAAVDSRQPAAELANENDVPVETVRRWIKEARRRGFLPPGQKGRAG